MLRRRYNTTLLSFTSTERIITHYQYSWGWSTRSARILQRATYFQAWGLLLFVLFSWVLFLCKTLDEEESLAVRTAWSTGWSKGGASPKNMTWFPKSVKPVVLRQGIHQSRTTGTMTTTNFMAYLSSSQIAQGYKKKVGTPRQNISFSISFLLLPDTILKDVFPD